MFCEFGFLLFLRSFVAVRSVPRYLETDDDYYDLFLSEILFWLMKFIRMKKTLGT
jgi:hypothetical protein